MGQCVPASPTNAYLEFALQLADAGGAAILPYFRQNGAVDNKLSGGFDPVTEADRACERIMRDMIGARYPDHGIVGEEFGVKEAQGAYRWILDPVDGTRSFVFGLSSWTTLIGLMHDNEPIVGVMNQPYVGESFYSCGEGSYWRRGGESRRIAVSPAPSLGEAMISATAPALFKSEREAVFLERMIAGSRAIRYDADAYFFCLLAAGHVDVALDAGLHAYDIAPLIPIIEGAGGIVTTWDGGSAAGGGNIIAAASQQLYEEALALLPA